MNTTWRIQATGASLAEEANVLLQSSGGMLQGRVETRHPDRGLHGISFRGQAHPDWRLLAPQLAHPHDPPLALAECYVRGDDLIVTYVEEREKLRREIYWRALQAPALQAHGAESIVSVQTSLLHSHPQLEMASRLSQGPAARLGRNDRFEFIAAGPGRVECTHDDGAGVFVLRPADADFSYVEMVHPSDFQQAAVVLDEDSASIVHSLFPESLEKGVIRRGRVRGWFVERQDDLTTAAELYRAWLAEPPPLTT